MSAFVVVEAASVGIPSIASAIGGITDLIRDGETGYLVKSDDDAGFLMALDKLLSSASLRRTMGEASRALALEAFDANRNFNGMLDRILARL
jgi:glycosyltransferase involved in cell wall biosynthesis